MLRRGGRHRGTSPPNRQVLREPSWAPIRAPCLCCAMLLGTSTGAASSIASQLASTSHFPLFVEGATHAQCSLPTVLNEDDEYNPTAAVRLFAAEGRCECAYDVREQSDGGYVAPAPLDHGPKSLPRTFQLSAERRLLRVVAPESAIPGLNWAIGLDGLRVLEVTTQSTVDWLLSIDEEEEEEMVERIMCGVQGEAFRKGGARGGKSMGSAVHLERIASDAAIVLPETCRVAAAMDGVLPRDTEVLWRVSPSSRQPTPMERSFDGGAISRPYWITAATASDARLLARSLPQNAVWAAHLRGRRSLPEADDVQMLREAGCGGLAVAWSEEVEAALDDGWYDAVSQTE